MGFCIGIEQKKSRLNEVKDLSDARSNVVKPHAEASRPHELSKHGALLSHMPLTSPTETTWRVVHM